MMTIRRNLEYECLCQMINKLIEQLTGRLSKTCQYALFFCFVFLGYLLLLLALKVNFIKNVLHDIFGNLLIVALAQGPYGRVHLARHGQVFRREFEMRTKVEPRATTIEHRYGGEVAQLAVVWRHPAIVSFGTSAGAVGAAARGRGAVVLVVAGAVVAALSRDLMQLGVWW